MNINRKFCHKVEIFVANILNTKFIRLPARISNKLNGFSYELRLLFFWRNIENSRVNSQFDGSDDICIYQDQRVVMQRKAATRFTPYVLLVAYTTFEKWLHLLKNESLTERYILICTYFMAGWLSKLVQRKGQPLLFSNLDMKITNLFNMHTTFKSTKIVKCQATSNIPFLRRCTKFRLIPG